MWRLIKGSCWRNIRLQPPVSPNQEWCKPRHQTDPHISRTLICLPCLSVNSPRMRKIHPIPLFCLPHFLESVSWNTHPWRLALLSITPCRKKIKNQNQRTAKHWCRGAAVVHYYFFLLGAEVYCIHLWKKNLLCSFLNRRLNYLIEQNRKKKSR